MFQYLEDFGCLISSALINKKPVSLFTEYESVGIGKVVYPSYPSVFLMLLKK